MIRRPPRSTSSPYTTPSRSVRRREQPLLRGRHFVHAAHRAAIGDSLHQLLGVPAALARRFDKQRMHVDEPLTVEHLAHRSEEHTSELQSQSNLVCRLLLEKE